jgi:hypothetical protein
MYYQAQLSIFVVVVCILLLGQLDIHMQKKIGYDTGHYAPNLIQNVSKN